MHSPLFVNLQVILFAAILSLNDLVSFGLVKMIYLKQMSFYTLWIPSLLYSLQMVIFYYGLNRTTSMTMLNILWNLMSSIFVTLVGIFYFQEKITHMKMWALLFGLVSIFLFSFGCCLAVRKPLVDNVPPEPPVLTNLLTRDLPLLGQLYKEDLEILR